MHRYAAALAAVLLWLTAATAAPLVPRAIVQTLPDRWVQAAAWLPDGRTLLTATAGSPAVTIWNADSGHILDTLTLPPVPNFRPLVVGRLSLDADATHAMLNVLGKSETENGVKMRWLQFVLDLKQRSLLLAKTPPSWIIDDTELRLSLGDGDRLLRLLTLPTAPDGRRLRRLDDSNGVEILDRDGTVIRALRGGQHDLVGDSDLSPDGRTFVALQYVYQGSATLAEVWDLANNRRLPTVMRSSRYDQVRWLDNRRYMVWQNRGDYNGVQVRNLLPCWLSRRTATIGPN